MTIPENWEKFGDLSPEDCSSASSEVLYSMKSRVGEIGCTFGDVPEYALPLDGGTYQRFDYPDLWAALPDAMKDPLEFHLPNFEGVFLRGGSISGVTGGEAQHILTIEEMPAHDHGGHVHMPGQLSGEAPTQVPDFPIPDILGSRGGGLPHNNLPPFYTVKYYVVAK